MSVGDEPQRYNWTDKSLDVTLDFKKDGLKRSDNSLYVTTDFQERRTNKDEEVSVQRLFRERIE